MASSRIIEIDDAGDERLHAYANLRSDQHRSQDAQSYIVEGRWCVQRLIDSPQTIISALVERGKPAEIVDRLPAEIPVYSLPTEEIQSLVGFHFHRGVLACARRPQLKSIDDLKKDPRPPAVALAILGVNQYENVGSMIRTAAAMGVQHLLIGPKTADPFARRTVRVSMGSIFRQQLYQLDCPEEQLNELRRSMNYRTLATTLDPQATPLSRFACDDRNIILMVGSEESGLEPQLQLSASDRVTIPMQVGVDSLNVSIAAAIFLYQLIQRRGESVS